MKLFSKSCETLFLGWDAPLLPRVVDVLRDRYAGDQQWDLSSLDCVLPSSHSVRRLDTLLHREADSGGLKLSRPRFLTLGQLAERLYRPPHEVASEFEQTLAWARVLRATPAEKLAPLVPVIPPQEPIGPWLELAGTLRGLHEELAASRLAFASVAEAAETEAEHRRWCALKELQEAYLLELAAASLSDPFCSRREAVLQNRCRSDQTVFLIGTSDLSDALVEMLRSLDSPLVALVAAPESESSRFDEFGCVDTESWQSYHLPLKDQFLTTAGDMLDQSTAVAEWMSDVSSMYAADQVTVGVTDESQVGPIELELRGGGWSTYRHLGWPLARTAIGRLFDLTANHLQRQTWQSLAALVRHADVHALISDHFADRDGDWLTELDRLRAQHFPLRVSDPLPPHAVKSLPLANEIGVWVTQWLSCFQTSEKPISQWSQVVEKWLSTLYQDGWQREVGSEPADVAGGLQSEEALPKRPDQSENAIDENQHRTWLALEAAGRLLASFAELNQQLDVAMEGAVAVEMLAARLSDARVLEQPESEEVQILGWLDLALDDAPALIVNGMNHPFVPRAVTSDPFLPGGLRAKLSIADNDRRFARDLYAMQLMLSARHSVRFIVGRLAADQSPTPPSRLLAAAEPRDIARRICMLLEHPRQVRTEPHAGDEPDRTLIATPELNAKPGEVKTLSVTAFRDYLICPYRFYLRHVLKLRPLDDSETELAANQFGDLIHGALESYGKSDDKHESDPDKIKKYLREHLHHYAAEQYSHSASTAVQIQVAQAERRLQAVATQQAKRIADGWRIDRVEASVGPKEDAKIVVDGESIMIKGRFDRIDVCESGGTRRWAILDYKTHGHPPEKKHLRKIDDEEQWIDLQLPLYRMMVPFLGIDADPATVALGYFNISEKDDETRINEAAFSEKSMKKAELLIHDCVRRIRAGDFAPTSDPVDYDDYAMILQTGVAGKMLDRLQASSDEGVDQ